MTTAELVKKLRAAKKPARPGNGAMRAYALGFNDAIDTFIGLLQQGDVEAGLRELVATGGVLLDGETSLDLGEEA